MDVLFCLKLKSQSFEDLCRDKLSCSILCYPLSFLEWDVLGSVFKMVGYYYILRQIYKVMSE